MRRSGADRNGDANPECDGLAPRGKPAVDEIPRSDRIAWQARGRPRRGVRKEGDLDERLGGRDTFEAKARRMVGAGGDLLPPQVSLEQLDAEIGRAHV